MGQMADQLRLHTKLQNFFAVGGITGEPMAGIANRVMQMLFTRRMPWKFNVAEYAPVPWGSGNFMVTQAGWQDVKFAGASCFVLQPTSASTTTSGLGVGGVGVDLAPTTVNNFTYSPVNGGTAGVSIIPSTGLMSVQTIDPHPFQTANLTGPPIYLTGLSNPAFNSTYTYNNLLGTASWTGGYQLLGIQSPYNFTVQGIQGAQYASITYIAASGGITTVACANTFSAGDILTFSSIAHNSGLNGQVITVLTATTSIITFATPSGVTITNEGDLGYVYAAPSGAPGIFNFSWLQSASIFDLNSQSFPPPIDSINAVQSRAKEYSTTGDKIEIAPVCDYNNGVIKFRLSEPLGNYPWGFSMSIQKRAPKIFQPGDIFPWPDELSYVIFEMCLWQGMRMAYGIGEGETQAQMQNAMASVMAALESQDREESGFSFAPDFSLMR